MPAVAQVQVVDKDMISTRCTTRAKYLDKYKSSRLLVD